MLLVVISTAATCAMLGAIARDERLAFWACWVPSRPLVLTRAIVYGSSAAIGLVLGLGGGKLLDASILEEATIGFRLFIGITFGIAGQALLRVDLSDYHLAAAPTSLLSFLTDWRERRMDRLAAVSARHWIEGLSVDDLALLAHRICERVYNGDPQGRGLIAYSTYTADIADCHRVIVGVAPAGDAPPPSGSAALAKLENIARIHVVSYRLCKEP